ncbi:MAG TPA: alpha-hydroxy acid oxidase [Candidatus Limnocylindrales bacterium]|nr:alpha-hydroxy acid oxidase [Candidatus Limnocylindrales bacterium]
MPAPVDLDAVLSLDGFEPLARERMEPAAFGYVAGGSWDEVTLRENVDAWQRRRFRPRVLVDLRSLDVSGTFLGRPSALPVAVAPMALHGLAHPEGELATARAAAAASVPFCLSTSSSRTIEEVAAAAPDAERWFQLYLVHDLDYSRGLVERAAAAGYRALVLTVDLPVLGYRERDRRTGFVMPPMGNLVDAPAAPRGRYGEIEGQGSMGLTWADLATVRGWSSMPLVLKGILTAEDARLAVEHDVAAIVVSNHGARQLDRSPATVDVLEEVVDAVEGRIPVWVDGGIRRGLDVLIARALGAEGVLLGRPLLWALAAGGQAGVERAFAILREELGIALPILGAASLDEVTRAHLG